MPMQIYFQAGLVILAFMITLWLFSLALKNASIVDSFWGTGFVILAWLSFAISPSGFQVRKLLLCTLVTVWGLRLTLYILLRNWGKPEDFRYAQWRADNGQRWWWFSFFQVFLLQGLLMWIIAVPLIAVQITFRSNRFTWLDILGALIWLVGFSFEAGGDWQLSRFKADPANRGKLLTRGLWRYTRHPNYFGDAAQWWGFYLIAATGGTWWTVFSPLLMTWLLLRVSGVAMLEKSLIVSRPGYEDYMQRTNAFFPCLPKRD